MKCTKFWLSGQDKCGDNSNRRWCIVSRIHHTRYQTILSSVSYDVPMHINTEPRSCKSLYEWTGKASPIQAQLKPTSLLQLSTAKLPRWRRSHSTLCIACHMTAHSESPFQLSLPTILVLLFASWSTLAPDLAMAVVFRARQIVRNPLKTSAGHGS